MPTEDNKYGLEIGRGHSPINDHIFNFLIVKIGNNDFLDIGCNYSVLQRELGFGLGVDACKSIVDKNNDDGIPCIFADASFLPFDDKTFEIAVLSCVLQQINEPIKALNEARRVARRVFGITPYPNLSEWGRIGGNPWVRSVIHPEEIKEMGGTVEDINDGTHYFFEL